MKRTYPSYSSPLIHALIYGAVFRVSDGQSSAACPQVPEESSDNLAVWRRASERPKFLQAKGKQRFEELKGLFTCRGSPPVSPKLNPNTFLTSHSPL